MNTLLPSAFSSPAFLPHGHGYSWMPGIVWLHVISDALIALAYFSIPIWLVCFVRKRGDFPFRAVFLCFATFILACGATHSMEIWNVWHADHWLSGGLKAITAAASIFTAILLAREMPAALALPSAGAMEREIQTRREAEQEARELNTELNTANGELLRQISEREQSEERLRLATQAARIGAFDWNVQTGSNPWTPELESMYGLKPGEFAQTEAAWEALLHPEDRDSALATVHLAFETFAPQQGEWRAVWPDGTVRWIAGRFQVFKDKEGKPLRLAGVNLDITDRKQAEVATARLAALVESSDDAIVGKDLSGIVTSWNGGAEKVFGYTAREMVGHPITRLIPADRLHEAQHILDRIREGESVRHLDTVRLRKDGTTIDVSITVSAVKDSHGNVIGASKVARDITEQKRAEATQRDSEERMHLATEATAVGIWEWNVLTNRIRWDAQLFRIYGIPPSPDGFVDYSTWSTAVVPEDLQEQEERLQETIHRGGRGTRRFRIRRPGDGENYRYIEAVETVRTNAQGQAEWVVGTNLDITERKRAEEEIRKFNAELEGRVAERTSQLEAANNELEAFSYSVSHDLRAPLRAVDGFSQAVLEDYGPHLPEECQAHLRTIRGGAQKMGRLIDDLLTFSRLSRSTLHKQEVNTEALVRSVLSDLGPQQEGRQIDLRIGGLPGCAGDPSMLKQVWMNLLSNALKYTQRRNDVMVEIGCEQKPEGNVYFVRDNGTGFDMRYAGKLFGVFQRLHRAEEFEGTGVGLALVQRIIHRHGGRVWAEAEVDRGATFFFTLEDTPKK